MDERVGRKHKYGIIGMICSLCRTTSGQGQQLTTKWGEIGAVFHPLGQLLQILKQR